jgi:hypothetical protein
MATASNTKKTSLYVMGGGVSIFLIGLSVYFATNPTSSFSSVLLVTGILIMLASVVLLGFSFQI